MANEKVERNICEMPELKNFGLVKFNSKQNFVKIKNKRILYPRTYGKFQNKIYENNSFAFSLYFLYFGL